MDLDWTVDWTMDWTVDWTMDWTMDWTICVIDAYLGLHHACSSAEPEDGIVVIQSAVRQAVYFNEKVYWTPQIGMCMSPATLCTAV